MRETNDLKISAAIRRELSSRRIDLTKLKFPVKSGEVTIEGDLQFVGLEKTNDEIAIELKFIESSIKGILGVSKINFEFNNWKKNDSGIWESTSSSSGSFKQIDGEGLVCPECDFVIRFCPCCGKPLVAGAKPGMHKSATSKPPIARKPGLPPIKPIVRKPRPIGVSSPLTTPTLKTSSSLGSSSVGNATVTPNKPITPVKVEPPKPINGLPTNENKSTDVDLKPVVAPIAKTTPSIDNNSIDSSINEISEVKPVLEADKPSVPNTPLASKPVLSPKPTLGSGSSNSPKPLKPLRPLKPLTGLKPLNKPGVTAPKPSIEAPVVSKEIKTPSEPPKIVEPPKPVVEVPNLVDVPQFASAPELTSSEKAVNNDIQNQAVANAGLPSDFNNSTFNSNTENIGSTPLPNFMLDNNGSQQNNQSIAPNIEQSQSSNSGFDLNNFGLEPNNTNTSDPFSQNNQVSPQIPDLGLDLGSLGSNFNSSNQAQPTVPDLGLNFGSLDSNIDNLQNQSQSQNGNQDFGNILGNGFNSTQNQTPDLDLGLGFDLGSNIPTSPTPSSLPDLGLGMPSQNEQPSMPNLDLGFNVPDLSNNLQGSNQNANPSNDIFGNSAMDFNNLNNGAPNDFGNQFLGNSPQEDETPLPPMRPAQQAPADSLSAFSLDSLGGEDETPLPPMRPAQSAAPKKAPAKKKSDDLFASLFNDPNLGGQDGLGNMDLDLEIFPSGDSGNLNQTAPAQQKQAGNDNPFNLGDSFLDLDSMLSSNNSGSGNLGEKDNTGAFNLDDFDIGNFKL